MRLSSVGCWNVKTKPSTILEGYIEKLKVDMETGQRGFIITGKEHFLEPFNIASKAIFVEIEELKEKVSDNPVQVARLERIEQKIHEWLKTAGEPEIAARRKYNRGELKFDDVAKLLIAETGKRQIDALRETLSDFIFVEETLIKERKKAAQSAISHTKIVIWIGGTIIVLVNLLTGLLNTQAILGRNPLK